jgi:hypothetical protein
VFSRDFTVIDFDGHELDGRVVRVRADGTVRIRRRVRSCAVATEEAVALLLRRLRRTPRDVLVTTGEATAGLVRMPAVFDAATEDDRRRLWARLRPAVAAQTRFADLGDTYRCAAVRVAEPVSHHASWLGVAAPESCIAWWRDALERCGFILRALYARTPAAPAAADRLPDDVAILEADRDHVACTRLRGGCVVAYETAPRFAVRAMVRDTAAPEILVAGSRADPAWVRDLDPRATLFAPGVASAAAPDEAACARAAGVARHAAGRCPRDRAVALHEQTRARVPALHGLALFLISVL